MTYSENSSPAYYAHAEALDDAARETFGHDWADRAANPEARRFVDYGDVDAPDLFIVTGYGGDHRRLIPAAYEG